MSRALITGATSGIGRAFAERLAAEGYDLLLTGRRERVLCDVAQGIQERHGLEAEVQIVELADETALHRLLEVARGHDDIDLLVNNAGFGHQAAFIEDTWERQHAMLLVHLHAALRITQVVGRAMARRRRGAIITVSSMLSLAPLPNSALYCATKAFLTSFSESLAMELRPYGVRVQALLPGLTHTDFHKRPDPIAAPRGSHFPGWMSPEAVVDCSLAALRRTGVICIPGFKNRLLARLAHSLPKPLLYRVMDVGRRRLL